MTSTFPWLWFGWVVFLGVLIWAAVSRRPYRYEGYRGYRGPWGHGAQYGGPEFGIPYEWPRATGRSTKARGPRDYRRSDQRIAEDINDRLLVEAGIDASDVHVAVRDGRVELTGVVESRMDKRIVEALADSVPGTADVDNRLAIGKISP